MGDLGRLRTEQRDESPSGKQEERWGWLPLLLGTIWLESGRSDILGEARNLVDD